MGGARRRPDKSVTFNNEDLFNIYERDNSTSFELCSPLATNSPINPPAASSPRPLTPITAPTPPCPPLPATPLSLMCSRSLAVASLHQYPEAGLHNMGSAGSTAPRKCEGKSSFGRKSWSLEEKHRKSENDQIRKYILETA